MEFLTDLGEGYSLWQERDCFRFSEDAVLLSKFFQAKKNDKILDIGCGNGILPILLYMQKYTNITGVEIQGNVYHLAQKNLDFNKLDNIKIVNCDVNDLKMGNSFDAIISNPPYMKVDGKKINLNESLAIARHELKLDIDGLVRNSRRLLKPIGSLTIVHRSYRFLEICEILKRYNFCVKRVKFVHNKDEAILVLIEALKGKKHKFTVLPPIYLGE